MRTLLIPSYRCSDGRDVSDPIRGCFIKNNVNWHGFRPEQSRNSLPWSRKPVSDNRIDPIFNSLLKMTQTFFIFIMALLFSVVSQGQTSQSTINYLRLPSPIVFENKSYNLVYSAHPSANFYKQEYIAKGEAINKFKTMILIDLITGSTNSKDVVAAKVAELKKLKETNPIVNYEVLEHPKTGEFILDFLLSQNAPDGKSISILERNVYRYKLVTDPSGKKGILLFGVSKRSYGAETDKFLASLKLQRADLIQKVSQFNIPDLILAK